MKTQERVLVAIVAAACMLPGAALARVSGQCSNCHTMHNSQNGSAVVATGPYEALTKGDCLICHTGANLDAGGIPKVQGSTAPAYGTDTLAGGSFWWVSQANGDTKGHNVDLVTGTDSNLGNTPPGGTALSAQLTCAGSNGCHGDSTVTTGNFAAISGAHHSDDTTLDGTTTGTSYRFLKGIKGIEDSDWEYSRSASDHNQYYGDARTADTVTDAATISALCARCHTKFHNGADSDGIDNATFGSPWIRHPTDIDLTQATGSEYQYYNDPTNTGTNNYNPDVPVGTENLADGVQAVVMDGTDKDAIVLCVSCHRAHGSPNDDLLRWDYSTIQAHSSATDVNSGCFVCHTTKDKQ